MQPEHQCNCAGRAVVELTIEKPDGSLAYVTNEGGGPQRQARSPCRFRPPEEELQAHT